MQGSASPNRPCWRQFPIEPAEPIPPPSRDFVPWRFSDAEHRSLPPQGQCRRPRNLHNKRRSKARSRQSVGDPTAADAEMWPTTIGYGHAKNDFVRTLAATEARN